MRRFFVLVVTSIGLASCTQQGLLPAQDVLRKSTEANQALVSATFMLDSDFIVPSAALGTLEGTLKAKGIMQRGGKQLHMNIATTGTSTVKDATWDIHADVTVISEKEVYLQLQKMDIDPMPALLSGSSIPQLTKQWWLLPSGTGAVHAPTDITPDPRFIKMQTETITIINDRGLATINGRKAYHYDVALDEEKLKTFLQNTGDESAAETAAMLSMLKMEGELWIDAETYVLHKADWTIGNKLSPVNIHLTVSITDHNADLVIIPPPSALPLPIQDVTSSMFLLSLPVQPHVE